MRKHKIKDFTVLEDRDQHVHEYDNKLDAGAASIEIIVGTFSAH